MQSPKGQQLLTSLDLATDQFETMVLLMDGKPYYKSEAFFKVTKQLNKPWPWFNILRLCPLIIRDWTYDRIALNRYRLFGRNNFCMIPTDDISERFI